MIITPPNEPEITVDNIEVAQFIYLMLYNQKIRDVIDTITSKVVLILGRFTPERKQVLDRLRDELRKRNYLPVVFDSEKPTSRTTDETITLLARMARFVIADVSDAKSILQELRAIVPALPSVAVQPLILVPQEEPGMFDFFHKFPWFLEPYRYDSQKHLLANLKKSVVNPPEAKVLELRGRSPLALLPRSLMGRNVRSYPRRNRKGWRGLQVVGLIAEFAARYRLSANMDTLTRITSDKLQSSRLRAMKPADLPIQQATKFELVISCSVVRWSCGRSRRRRARSGSSGYGRSSHAHLLPSADRRDQSEPSRRQHVPVWAARLMSAPAP